MASRFPEDSVSAARTEFLFNRIKDLVDRVGSASMTDVSRICIAYRLSAVERYVADRFGGKVQSGPFAGMRYTTGPKGSLFVPKAFGTYEAELSPIFEQIDRYSVFVDVGCAEGYFAVGCARRNPDLQVFAFDIDPKARESCRMLAEANGVSDRMSIGERCTAEDLVAHAGRGTLVLVDIEGAEVDLLSSETLATLARCDLIVETHTRRGGSTRDILVDRLAKTHDVVVVEQTTRDPMQFPDLRKLGQLDRLLALWEGRGPEPWLFARARRSGQDRQSPAVGDS